MSVAQKQKSTVKLLVYALGIRPEEFLLLPDDHGWISTKELLKALAQDGTTLREGALKEAALVTAPDELEISDKMIRAKVRQPVEQNDYIEPPGLLYYGARQKAYPIIREKGLNGQPQVILCATSKDALKLGQRRDQDPVLVTIHARNACESGLVFSKWGDLYLTGYVDARFLSGPTIKEPLAPTKTPKPSPAEREILPGSFNVTEENLQKAYKQKGLKKEIAWKKERRQQSRKDS